MRRHDSDKRTSSLATLRERFAAWRRTRSRGERIPASLWRSAGQCAAIYGLHRTAKTLGLDYYSLKKHMAAETSGKRPPEAFVALPALPTTALSECLIELENGTGASIRVHLKGVQVPDLVALSRELWGTQ